MAVQLPPSTSCPKPISDDLARKICVPPDLAIPAETRRSTPQFHWVPPIWPARFVYPQILATQWQGGLDLAIPAETRRSGGTRFPHPRSSQIRVSKLSGAARAGSLVHQVWLAGLPARPAQGHCLR
eukprot:15474819-Alexandrium_andersonii.AAC.1